MAPRERRDNEIVAVGLMCKPPRPGVTKTRLAATIGPELAAALSECFLRDVARLIDDLEARHRIRGFGVYTPADAAAEIRTLLPASFELVPQQGADFSAVVHRAVDVLLERHRAGAILINADSPTLPAALLANAVGALRAPGERVVLGPALDGGYYLIGLKTAYWSLFREMPWSTSDVERITIARAEDIGLPVVRLPVWYDVDNAASLALLLDEIAGAQPDFAGFSDMNGPELARSSPASATSAFLRSHPEIERLCRESLGTEKVDQ